MTRTQGTGGSVTNHVPRRRFYSHYALQPKWYDGIQNTLHAFFAPEPYNSKFKGQGEKGKQVE